MGFEIKSEQGGGKLFGQILNQNKPDGTITGDDTSRPTSSFTMDTYSKKQPILLARRGFYVRRGNSGSGGVRSLRRNKVIQGVPCKGSKSLFVSYHDNGKIEECWLSKNAWIKGLPASVEQPVAFYDNGNWKRLTISRDITIQGYALRASAFLLFNRKGTLMEGELRRGKKRGLSCKGFALHDNDKMDRCELRKDTKIQGYRFKASVTVGFDESGKLNWARGHSVSCFGIKFPSGFNARFKKGKLSSIKIAVGEGNPTRLIVQGLPCTWRPGRRGDRIDLLFHRNGQLKEARLWRDITIQGKRCSRGDIVRFSKNGKLKK